VIDGVGVVAILQKPSGPEILLQKQFRPPVGKVCIEIPAGLLDSGETAAQCAVRELKEETGYVGEAVSSGNDKLGVMFNDPGFTNTNLQLVYVKVDAERPENQPDALKAEPEEHEFITTFSVPLRDMWEEFRRLEEEGYAIDARVGTIAEGIRLAGMWGLGK
jgi:ADP-ribose pyrophosphatase